MDSPKHLSTNFNNTSQNMNFDNHILAPPDPDATLATLRMLHTCQWTLSCTIATTYKHQKPNWQLIISMHDDKCFMQINGRGTAGSKDRAIQHTSFHISIPKCDWLQHIQKELMLFCVSGKCFPAQCWQKKERCLPNQLFFFQNPTFPISLEHNKRVRWVQSMPYA